MQPNDGSQLSKDKSSEALLEAALTSLSKALKAIGFYPLDHPMRDESVSSALLHLKPLLQEKELILLWSRDGCSVAERAPTKSTSATAKILAREMLTRKLQRMTIIPELSEKDLKAFLAILTTEPADIMARGGVEKEMLHVGIRTIGANEVDLTVLQNLNSENNDDSSSTDTEDTDDSTDGSSSPEETMQMDDPLGINALLEKLVAEQHEAAYAEILRGVIDVCEKMTKSCSFISFPFVLSTLLDQYYSDKRGVSEKEYTKYSLEQIVDGGLITYFLDLIENKSPEMELLFDRLCKTIGKTLAYPLIQKLCIAESLHTRKIIATFLAKTGEAGIPALASMLKDERWYVVRNMVTILGEIPSAATLPPLQGAAGHSEPKVRKEVIKSLVKRSPAEGEISIINFLTDNDREVVRQAIHSLGAIRSNLAVMPLIEIITAPDIFLKEIELKKLAISAIGRIGNRLATATLMDVLIARGWLAPRNWIELKVAAASAIGRIGDETALPLLRRLSRSKSPVGEACAEAADNIERVVK